MSRIGSGVPDVFNTWHEQGWDEPTVEERYGAAARTFLTLLLVSTHGKISDRKLVASEKTQAHLEAVLQYMQPGSEYVTAELAVVLGLQKPRTRDILCILQKQGKMTAIGSNRNCRYVKLVD